MKKDIIQKILDIEEELLEDQDLQTFCIAVQGSDPVECDFAGRAFRSGAKAIVG